MIIRDNRVAGQLVLVVFNATGWLLTRLPTWVARSICVVAGELTWWLTPRGGIALRNLHHAFPDKPHGWHRKMARESIRRTMEMFLFVGASPHFNDQRFRKIVTADEAFFKIYDECLASNQPLLVLVPHCTLMESLTYIPAYREKKPVTAVMFRPIDNPAVDAYVKITRERFGARLVAKSEELTHLFKDMRHGGWVSMLYDQNTGKQGALVIFMGRVASVTELPGLLARKFRAPVYGLYPERTGFWTCQLRMEKLLTDGTPASVTLVSTQWLEALLKESDNTTADWLWCHQRWKILDWPTERFNTVHKRSLLDKQYPDAVLPRRTRLWIRLPNWLGDVVMLIPLLRALRKGRPDMEITLIGLPHFAELVKRWSVGDRYIALPSKHDYFRTFWRYRREYADTYLLFTNSFRGDLEAWLTRTPQRFGILRAGKPRPLLTHGWRVPMSLNESAIHQTCFWHKYLEHFGLHESPDTTPLEPPLERTRQTPRIGLICGTENSPEKRWPVEHWRALITGVLERIPQSEIVLFGTKRDNAITSVVADGFVTTQVMNEAGRTTLCEFVDALRACDLLVCNDTGGMHLANAVGVPVIALYGPTNPIRTGPVFNAQVDILQAPGCLPTGGGAMVEITPERVLNGVVERLNVVKSE
ncbi:MAG: glycosyltransferase family 9 protein [Verrucomicrobiota bacterium]|nr:glycosyltransferase family 9 protein [Verrucomicrobiota bacterium]